MQQTVASKGWVASPFQNLLQRGSLLASHVLIDRRCCWGEALTEAALLSGDTQSMLLCFAVLCCAVLCCAVLCCAMLCCAVLCTTSSVVNKSYVAMLQVIAPSCICNIEQSCRPVVVKASSPACRTQNTACTAAAAGQLICSGQLACGGGYLFSKDERVVTLVFELPPLGLA